MTLVIAKSLQHGSREGIKMALAPLITDCAIVGISLFLIHSVSRFSALLALLSFSGAFLLFYLAWENWRHPLPDTDHGSESPHSILQGALVNMLSPHPWLFWFTVGAPLLHDAWKQHVLYALLFLSAFYLFLVGAKVVTALSLGLYGRLLQDRHRVLIMRFLASVLFGFAFLLLWKGWQQW